MKFFDNLSFKEFLGVPIYEENHIWGVEQRFRVLKKDIEHFAPVIRDTLYHHHSSFNYQDEINALGFTLTADSIRKKKFWIAN
jgi:hypothetical protein